MSDHRTVKTGFGHFVAAMPGRKYPTRSIQKLLGPLFCFLVGMFPVLTLTLNLNLTPRPALLWSNRPRLEAAALACPAKRGVGTVKTCTYMAIAFLSINLVVCQSLIVESVARPRAPSDGRGE